MPTLNKSCRFPIQNSLRFIPANDALTTGYNTWPADRGFFYQHIKTFYQTNTNYNQKVLMSDEITIYLDCLADTIDILILDVRSNTVTTVTSALASAYTIAGNVDSHYGDQYNTFIYQFNPVDILGSGGFYYVLVRANYAGDADTDTNTMFVTECLHIRTDAVGWPETVKIEYQNDENDYDVFWEMLRISSTAPWAFRIEAVLDIDPGSHVIQFQNMFWKNEKLQDIPFSIAEFMVGGGGIPDWAVQKMNFIMACDTFTIDGERWYKDTNAAISMKKSGDFAKKAFTIKLMNDPSASPAEYNNAGPSTFRFHDDFMDEFHD